MTPSDEAALARIAAFGLSQGEGQAAIENRLLSYASILTEEQVQTAMERGRGILDVAADIQAGRYARAALGMADIAIPGLPGWSVYAKYEVARGPDMVWRSVSVRMPGQTQPGDIARVVGAAIQQQEADSVPGANAPVIGDVVPVWLAPSL